MYRNDNDKAKMKETQYLCFPEYEFRTKSEKGKNYIFDEIRRKWLVITPEEIVRQHVVKLLTCDLAFPKNYIALEKKVLLAGRSLRFDALVYDPEIKPLMIIECKAPTVALTQEVFDQIWNYNIEISAPFFVVTNGVDFIMGRHDATNGIEFFDKVKTFSELLLLRK